MAGGDSDIGNLAVKQPHKCDCGNTEIINDLRQQVANLQRKNTNLRLETITEVKSVLEEELVKFSSDSKAKKVPEGASHYDLRDCSEKQSQSIGINSCIIKTLEILTDMENGTRSNTGKQDLAKASRHETSFEGPLSFITGDDLIIRTES
ncbi:Uncharacterised protein [uncultured archaeon]|nr:Uncharacterised protein [uncultured archaeon]